MAPAPTNTPVSRLNLNGINYLRNPKNQDVYDVLNFELIGKYDPINNRIVKSYTVQIYCDILPVCAEIDEDGLPRPCDNCENNDDFNLYWKNEVYCQECAQEAIDEEYENDCEISSDDE